MHLTPHYTRVANRQAAKPDEGFRRHHTGNPLSLEHYGPLSDQYEEQGDLKRAKRVRQLQQQRERDDRIWAKVKPELDTIFTYFQSLGNAQDWDQIVRWFEDWLRNYQQRRRQFPGTLKPVSLSLPPGVDNNLGPRPDLRHWQTLYRLALNVLHNYATDEVFGLMEQLIQTLETAINEENDARFVRT
jgi:hypothetical protein